MKSKEVVIVGGGYSGLVAAVEAIKNGFIPVILEKESDIGGELDLKTGQTFWGETACKSKFSMELDGLDYDIEGMFPNSLKMNQYLKKYAKHFKLEPYIKFETKVTNISHQDKDFWLVESECNGQKSSQIAKYLIVATGVLSEPNIPVGIEVGNTSKDTIIHSKNYKNSLLFADQDVLVVGGSFNGVGICSKLVERAKSVTHLFHNPFWVGPHLIPENPSSSKKLPIDLAVYKHRDVPLKDYSETGVRAENSKKHNYMKSTLKQDQSLPITPQTAEDFSSPVRIAVDDHYIQEVQATHIIPMKGEIVGCSQDGEVMLKDGTKQKFDKIILATGFKPDLSFLSEELLNILHYDPNNPSLPLALPYTCLHPELPNININIGFVGMYRGASILVIEQQAKLLLRLFSGDIKRPGAEEIAKDLAEEILIQEQYPSPKHPHEDQIAIADKLAKIIGNFPDVTKLIEKYPNLKDKENRIEELLKGPVTGAHYRLLDDPEEALHKMETIEDIIKLMGQE
jgi:dimethylaniline monooxygenase (N-oxide forming)